MTSKLQKTFAEWEQHIHAFVENNIVPMEVVGVAGRRTHGSLSGLTIAVKDIIDVEGFRTRNGSDACCSTTPATNDAPVVSSLRLAGGQIIGKTTTTEYAYTDPTSCRNPYDIRRTPGGSSSGSGAAVAAGMVDIALGTQTAGSLIRPAAYCGVVGFKPSYGILPTIGVTPLAPSFDTVGLIARSVKLVRTAFAAMSSIEVRSGVVEITNVSAITSVLPTEIEPSHEAITAIEGASKVLELLKMKNQRRDLVVDVETLVSDHRVVMNYEASNIHQDLLSEERIESLKPKFREGLLAGKKTTKAEFEMSGHKLSQAKKAFWAHLAGVDIVLTLPVPDGAPLIDGTTGFQEWLTPWTVFGGPLLTLPWGLDDFGRPRAVMLAAHPGQDMLLLEIATAMEKHTPLLPFPETPTPA